jgi:hypothetical protein
MRDKVATPTVDMVCLLTNINGPKQPSITYKTDGYPRPFEHTLIYINPTLTPKGKW